MSDIEAFFDGLRFVILSVNFFALSLRLGKFSSDYCSKCHLSYLLL
jgi:hypothetical protein